MKKIAIIGFGRFGQLLADLTKDEFEVSVVEVNEELKRLAESRDYKAISINDLGEVDDIFLAVPISKVEAVIKEIAPQLNDKQVVIDVCSVKVYPANLMKKYLPHCQILASHPLFGPDSASKGLEGLKIVLCSLNVSPENLSIWKKFWSKKGLEVIEATPEEHDKDSVFSMAFTYSLARIILEMNIPPLLYTTRSYNDLKEVAELSAKDTDELFHDMLFYNPYFKSMMERLERASGRTLKLLLQIAAEQDNP